MKGETNMSKQAAPSTRNWRTTVMAVVAALTAGLAAGLAQAALTPVYRFYHLDAGRHFYTANEAEKNKVLELYPRFAFEGIAFYAYETQEPGTVAVYRFYHQSNGSHVYTASESEKSTVITNYPVYAYEGVAYYAEPNSSNGAVPLYRLYNTRLGTHFFTTSFSEATYAVNTWPWFAYEGAVFHVRSAASAGAPPPANGRNNVPPTTTLAASASMVKVGDFATLTATAADSDGTVAKVEYFQGYAKIGETTSPPHVYGYTFGAAGTFAFSAVATDNGGMAGASSTVMITAVATGGGTPPPPAPPVNNVPPVVTLGASSTAITVGASTNLSAAAVDTDGSIAKVMFYNGATLLGTVTSAPYAYSFTPGAAGTFTVSAVAVDDQNAQGSSNTITVVATATAPPPSGTNNAPAVSLGASATALTVGSSTALTASAADSDGTIAKVMFYSGTTLLGQSTTPPYTFSFTPSVAGTFLLTAVAVDDKAAQATSNAVTVVVSAATGGNAAPAVAISATPTTFALGTATKLKAFASDADGTITKVEFYEGLTLLGQVTVVPYTFDYTPATAGAHSVSAIAYDDLGAKSVSNLITVTATTTAPPPPPPPPPPGNIAPTVSLAASSMSIVSGATSTLTATAADADGTIARVEFFDGTTLLLSDLTSPYTHSFSSTVVGTHVLKAVAYDNVNASTTSATVSVVVTAATGGTNVAPTVTLAASPMTFVAGGASALTATAADSDGTVAKVEFYDGATLLNSDATAPYTFTFTTSILGNHAITARAYDNSNAITNSTIVNVNVTSAATTTSSPRISLNLSNTLVPAGTTVILTGTASAVATGATVAMVSFYMNGTKLTDDTVTPYSFPAVAPAAPGSYPVYATVTDSLGNTASTLIQTIVVPAVPPVATTDADIWRLLNQATFGASQAEAARVLQLGSIAAWIDDQFTKPVSGYPDSRYNRIQLGTTADCTTQRPNNGGNYPGDSPEAMCARDHLSLAMVQRDFFTNALSAPDQLRQRVAWALSQIVVTSANEQDLSYAHVMSRYQSIMFEEAFGNYETLLRKVTYNPAMGNYLDMVNNDRPAGTRVPNENYAREIMQLFSIGLDELNADGTPLLDAQNNPIPTYGQAEIAEFARVFTGYTYANAAGTAPTGKTGTRYYGAPMANYPMTNTTGHDPLAKSLLNGSVLPAGNTAQQDIDAAVLNVFMHPNTGPYVSKQLIQRLVTGNPTPAYVARISGVFANNGNGVRGDLAAVVRAILLDPEARGGAKAASDFGTLKEPVLMVAGLLRALSGVTDGSQLEGATNLLGQRPYFAPTVFNYFPPDATIPGTAVLGPEFAIHTTNSAVARANLVYRLVYQGYNADTTIPGSTGTRLFIAQFEPLADNPVAMVAQINKVLAGGQFPAALEPTIVAAVNVVPMNATTPTAAERTNRARMAVYLMASSYDFQVQR
jgi:uncharacterized protein (DUF1800 family)